MRATPTLPIPKRCTSSIPKRSKTKSLSRPTRSAAPFSIVEDNQEILQYLSNGLSELFNTLQASNGEAALDVLKEHEVDIVITDVMMPVMDGIKLWQSHQAEHSYLPHPRYYPFGQDRCKRPDGRSSSRSRRLYAQTLLTIGDDGQDTEHASYPVAVCSSVIPKPSK